VSEWVTTHKRENYEVRTREGAEGRIYRCKRCGFVRRASVPYHARSTTTWNEYTGRKTDNHRTYDEPSRPRCACPSEHESRLTYAVVKGHFVAGEKCGAKCRYAIGPACDCSCAGRRHGEGYVEEQAYAEGAPLDYCGALADYKGRGIRCTKETGHKGPHMGPLA